MAGQLQSDVCFALFLTGVTTSPIGNVEADEWQKYLIRWNILISAKRTIVRWKSSKPPPPKKAKQTANNIGVYVTHISNGRRLVLLIFWFHGVVLSVPAVCLLGVYRFRKCRGWGLRLTIIRAPFASGPRLGKLSRGIEKVDDLMMRLNK